MNIAKMMQQAKEMQGKMEEMQAELGQIEVNGESGGGLVKVTMTCKGELRALDIDPSILVASEKEIVEDLIKAAINDGKNKGDATMADKTQSMMSDMGLPAGTQLPF